MVVRQLDGRRQSPRTHDSTPSSCLNHVPTMSQPKALLPLPLGAVARLVARAGRAIYVGNRAALHDPARLAALFQRSDDLHRASSEGERREEGGDRGRDCLLQQHWRQSGGPPPKTQAEHCGRPRWRSLPFGSLAHTRRHDTCTPPLESLRNHWTWYCEGASCEYRNFSVFLPELHQARGGPDADLLLVRDICSAPS